LEDSSFGVEMEDCEFHPGGVRVYAYVGDDEPTDRDIEWVLLGPGGVVEASGRLEWDAESRFYESVVGDFSLEVGHYRVNVTMVDEARVIVQGEFNIVHCVSAEAGCHAVTFTNPPGNPPVRVRYGPSQTEDWPDQDPGKGGSMVLQPGQSRAVDTFHYEISWEAFGPADRDVKVPNAGGDYSELPDQHCGPTMTRGVIGCAVNGRGTVDARLSPPSSRGLRYRIVHEMEPGELASGRVGSNRRVQMEVPAGFSYIFRSYTSGHVMPYDQAWIDVPPCVTAVQTCHTIKFSNPSDATVAVSYRPSGRQRNSTVRIKAGRSRTVSVPPGQLTWRATAKLGVGLWELDPGRGSLRIDPACVSPSDPNRLPNTGAPVTGWAGRASVVLVGTGLALLLRRRRVPRN
jgi:hypothetical protein